MARRLARSFRFTNTTRGASFAPTMARRSRGHPPRGIHAALRLFAERFALTAARTGELESAISDLQFTSRYRVPFQFSRFVANTSRRHLLESSAGPTVTDLDGNRFFD